MGDAYMDTVTSILKRGQFANSYKFALLRSLAAFGAEQGSGYETVEHEWLAGKFIEFYWPLTVRFKIRQATVPNKDPVVMRYIRNEKTTLGLSPETSLPKYQNKYQDRHAQLVPKVVRKAFADVIPRFHTVGKKEVKPALYEPVGEGILIDADARQFLNANHKALDLLAIGSWVKFTEKFSSAPRLYEKIQGLKFKRSALKPYKEFFQTVLGETNCFYCGREAQAQSHVDHVIPWSFVAEDKVWNLVLSCEKCNGEKSSQTPEDPFVEKLIRRNEALLAMDDSKFPPSVIRDLTEWRPGGLQKNVEILVVRCRADGFGTWS